MPTHSPLAIRPPVTLPDMGKVSHAVEAATFACKGGLTCEEWAHVAYRALREAGHDKLADALALEVA